jgi:hypothetical protein
MWRYMSGGCPARFSRPQLFQQRLRFLQIARVEPLSEPPVNRSQQFARFAHLALVAPEACEAHGGTEFPGRRPCTSLRSRRSPARSLRPISGRPIYPSQAKQLPTENSVGKMWMRISADWGKIYVAVSYFDGVCRCDSCVTSYRRSRCPNQRKKQNGSGHSENEGLRRPE